MEDSTQVANRDFLLPIKVMKWRGFDQLGLSTQQKHRDDIVLRQIKILVVTACDEKTVLKNLSPCLLANRG